ncbi:MAG: hypothetical protein QM698_00165 [Micropepsaceae bacterium]
MIARAALAAVSLCGFALAGAWPQSVDHGLSISSVGYASGADDGARVLFDSYAEAGLGDGFTAVFTFESELAHGMAVYGWRAAAGLRYSHEPAASPWLFSIEARISYQDYGSAIGDPVFAGDGAGAVLQADAGRAFQIAGLHAFANVSAGWSWRGNTADEWRVNAVAGIDLSDSWQIGAGYFSTYAPGDLYDPGVYEKHEAQLSLRWRIDADYALAISAGQTISADRAAEETTLRLALWTLLYPAAEDD